MVERRVALNLFVLSFATIMQVMPQRCVAAQNAIGGAATGGAIGAMEPRAYYAPPPAYPGYYGAPPPATYAPGSRVVGGAARGAAVGAVGGAVSGNAAEGAKVGAVAGGAIGAMRPY